MRKLNIKRLNASGAAHLLIPMLIVVGAGIIGSYVAVKSISHADTPINQVRPYNGNDDGCGSNATHYYGSTHVGRSYYDGGSGSVCKCENGKTIPYSAVRGNATNTGCTSSTTSSGNSGGVRSYNGNDDGCGSNATHYNGSTHVGRSNYGSGSICKCDNGRTFAYGAVQGNNLNKKCSGSTASSNGGNNFSGHNFSYTEPFDTNDNFARTPTRTYRCDLGHYSSPTSYKINYQNLVCKYWSKSPNEGFQKALTVAVWSDAMNSAANVKYGVTDCVTPPVSVAHGANNRPVCMFN